MISTRVLLLGTCLLGSAGALTGGAKQPGRSCKDWHDNLSSLVDITCGDGSKYNEEAAHTSCGDNADCIQKCCLLDVQIEVDQDEEDLEELKKAMSLSNGVDIWKTSSPEVDQVPRELFDVKQDSVKPDLDETGGRLRYFADEIFREYQKCTKEEFRIYMGFMMKIYGVKLQANDETKIGQIWEEWKGGQVPGEQSDVKQDSVVPVTNQQRLLPSKRVSPKDEFSTNKRPRAESNASDELRMDQTMDKNDEPLTLPAISFQKGQRVRLDPSYSWRLNVELDSDIELQIEELTGSVATDTTAQEEFAILKSNTTRPEVEKYLKTHVFPTRRLIKVGRSCKDWHENLSSLVDITCGDGSKYNEEALDTSCGDNADCIQKCCLLDDEEFEDAEFEDAEFETDDEVEMNSDFLDMSQNVVKANTRGVVMRVTTDKDYEVQWDGWHELSLVSFKQHGPDQDMESGPRDIAFFRVNELKFLTEKLFPRPNHLSIPEKETELQQMGIVGPKEDHEKCPIEQMIIDAHCGLPAEQIGELRHMSDEEVSALALRSINAITAALRQ